MVFIPKVSVVVPAYNVSHYIEDALRSLQRQSFKEFEVLIVDDGSTDNTAEIVKPYVKSDSRFQLWQKQNGGLSSARNHGIRHARGEYIALLDGDDIYHSDKLARHVATLNHHPEVGVVYSASRAIRDDGKPTPIYLSGKPVHSDPLLALLCKNFVGHGSNAVFHRSLIGEVGEFDESLRSSEDIDFWLRVATTRKWQFYRDKSTLCYYRVRPSGLSFNVAQMQRCNEQVIQSAYQRSPQLVKPMLPTAYAYMYRYLARLSLQGGNLDQASHFIDRALACNWSIFYRDPRSLVTLLAVRLAPLAKLGIRQTLGSVRYTQKQP
ncbi:glycosyltransferase [Scytonema sp. UIC 10036]|uniref:glycosyltransferase family 2 protein n=1 Tax=Scytonema sp. UIC 10036 TaxID=2304196 RepID=UPI0012DA58C8|nr:glycosyltransferase family A protein [Scytonema sp. UIC 10036]MUG96107.1 glycosyltransferase [Scytonema sp. UIC 10036]